MLTKEDLNAIENIVGRRFDKVDERFDRIDEKFDQIDEKFDQIDERLDQMDKRFDRNYQALYSYKLTFQFTTDAGSLNYLNGKSFHVEQVDFVKEYFPEVKLNP